eukprot:6590932-Alexandrium_andersonii.AAC.1
MRMTAGSPDLHTLLLSLSASAHATPTEVYTHGASSVWSSGQTANGGTLRLPEDPSGSSR